MIKVKGRAVVYGEVWFDEQPPADPGVDILVWRQRTAPAAGVPCKPFLTMVSDLSVPEEALTEPFINTCRYHVRRAESKDGLRTEFISDPASRLDEFCEFFDAFARQKSIELAERDWLEEACRAGQLVLTNASTQDATLVWHAYLTSGDLCWMHHSASFFREGNSEQRNLAGRANRWLHWRDMLAFKQRGVTRYDWGGMFEDESTPERAGINTFKRSFGGRLVRRCDYNTPVTVRGRLFLPLRDAWRRWSAPAQAPAAEDAKAAA